MYMLIMSLRSPCKGPLWWFGVPVGGEWDTGSAFTMDIVTGLGCWGLLLYDMGLWRERYKMDAM